MWERFAPLPTPAFSKPVDSDCWLDLIGRLKEGLQALSWYVFHTRQHNGNKVCSDKITNARFFLPPFLSVSILPYCTAAWRCKEPKEGWAVARNILENCPEWTHLTAYSPLLGRSPTDPPTPCYSSWAGSPRTLLPSIRAHVIHRMQFDFLSRPTAQATARHIHFGTLTPGVTVQIIPPDSQGPLSYGEMCPYTVSPSKAHGQAGHSPQGAPARLGTAVRTVPNTKSTAGQHPIWLCWVCSFCYCSPWGAFSVFYALCKVRHMCCTLQPGLSYQSTHIYASLLLDLWGSSVLIA